jgi:hypothetical protein
MVEEPESEWIVREERVATQPPEFPAKIGADNPAQDPESSSVMETTEVGRGPILPGPQPAPAGRVSSAQSVVRRVPSYNYRYVRVIRDVTAVLEVLLAIRFFLKLFGASPEAAFTLIVYLATDLFLVPFHRIFAYPAQGPYVFDSSALVALIVYPLLGWAIVGLIKIKTARRNPWTPTS